MKLGFFTPPPLVLFIYAFKNHLYSVYLSLHLTSCADCLRLYRIRDEMNHIVGEKSNMLLSFTNLKAL